MTQQPTTEDYCGIGAVIYSTPQGVTVGFISPEATQGDGGYTPLAHALQEGDVITAVIKPSGERVDLSALNSLEEKRRHIRGPAGSIVRFEVMDVMGDVREISAMRKPFEEYVEGGVMKVRYTDDPAKGCRFLVSDVDAVGTCPTHAGAKGSSVQRS